MEDLIKYYSNKKLLANGSSNTKLAKNTVKTYGLSLIPHSLNTKGVNLCKFSTKECRSLCLNKSGLSGMSGVQASRLKKTDFFINHKKEFIDKLWKELETINKKGKVAVRLNVVSDVNWEEEFNTFGYDLNILTNIQRYGYTKDHYQIMLNQSVNNSLTFSYSGYNWKKCDYILKNKLANVAIVFKNKLPKTYKGFEVINGDESDMRWLDGKGKIIGLSYKVPRGVKYTKNKFVIDE